jgi:hypothetical protein
MFYPHISLIRVGTRLLHFHFYFYYRHLPISPVVAFGLLCLTCDLQIGAVLG